MCTRTLRLRLHWALNTTPKSPEHEYPQSDSIPHKFWTLNPESNHPKPLFLDPLGPISPESKSSRASEEKEQQRPRSGPSREPLVLDTVQGLGTLGFRDFWV